MKYFKGFKGLIQKFANQKILSIFNYGF